MKRLGLTAVLLALVLAAGADFGAGHEVGHAFGFLEPFQGILARNHSPLTGLGFA